MPLGPRNQQKGTLVEWPIGRTGEGSLDIHPGRINSIDFGMDDRGRTGLVAEVVLQVTAREENGGGTYTRIRNILARFLNPSARKPIEGFDDVDMDALYEEASSAATTYLLSGQQSLAEQAEEILVPAGAPDAPPTEDPNGTPGDPAGTPAGTPGEDAFGGL